MVRILQGVSPSILDHNFSYGPKWTATDVDIREAKPGKLVGGNFDTNCLATSWGPEAHRREDGFAIIVC